MRTSDRRELQLPHSQGSPDIPRGGEITASTQPRVPYKDNEIPEEVKDAGERLGCEPVAGEAANFHTTKGTL